MPWRRTADPGFDTRRPAARATNAAGRIVAGVSAPDPSTTGAELGAIAETVRRSRDRVAALAEPYLGTEREDIVAAVYEAERHLRSAERTLERALKLTGGCRAPGRGNGPADAGPSLGATPGGGSRLSQHTRWREPGW